MTFVPAKRSTARLELRELEESDAEATNRWESDPEVQRYETSDGRTLDESRAYIRRSRTDSATTPRTLWDLLVTTKDGEPVGRVGFRITRPEHREATLWFVFRRDVWGRGYGTEAGEAILEIAFDAGVHRVFGDADPRNVGSWRVMEKLGMRREAHLRDHWFLKGEWCDSYLHAILEDAWRARRVATPTAAVVVVEDRPIRVLAIAGSLGARSSNAALVTAAFAAAPAGVTLVAFAGLGELPLFDPDRVATEAVEAWRAALRSVDAVLISTPEYGHSLPGVLKNAIDWVIGSGELERKAVAITASVPHADRGRRGLQALAQTLGAVRARIAWAEPIVRSEGQDRMLRALLTELATVARTPVE